jgi:flagellar hook assembly protein FlgD
MKNKMLFVMISLLLLSTCVFGEYPISASDPLGKKMQKITHNYGEYRGGASYKYHDGFDYQAKTGTPAYPISSGTAHIYPNNGGWGNCVIVDHGTFQTRYAHLSKINVSEGQQVETTTILGLSGNTGASDGEHLHFSIGSNGAIRNDLAPANTMNPILAGLKQPKYGEIRKVACPKGFEIRLLATGTDGTFGGTNDVILSDANETINIPKPGQPLKAVISAYHYTGRAYTAPYKIEFEVEKVKGANDFVKQKREIVFDSIANINAMSEPPYSFSRPYVTQSKRTEDYYSIKFIPTAGKYKITAKIYSCYRNDSDFHLSDSEVAQREITVGLNGMYVGDMDWYDPSVSFAWLPDDIAGGGAIMPASVPGGIRAAAVAPEGPEIFYAFANNNIITTNLLDVDQNLQKKAIIESRTKNKSNWTIRFYNSSGTKVDEKKISNQDWLRYEWAPSVPAGEYSFNVTAQDLTTSGVSTYESYETITIDNTKPSALISMISNSVSAPDQIISSKIKPSEDLYSVIVNVVNNRDYSMAQERVYTSPSGKKDIEETIEWEDAYSYPDGFYNFEIIMTDFAGNISKTYSPIVSVNKSGSFIPPPPNETYNPSLPAPPPWPERTKVSDIAFDSSGNQYVLYGRYNKIVKYNPSGEKLIEKTDFGGTPLFIPLGMCVSDNKVYIADSYNIRVLVCDNDLNLIREIKGQDVYATFGDIDSYSWFLFGRSLDHSSDAGGGLKKYSDEGYGLPEGAAFFNNNIYVTDKNKHRLLKYTHSGETSWFSVLKADLKDEARNVFNQNDTFQGRTVDRALIYSNSLNDKIIFDKNANDNSPYRSGWTKEMFLHMNLPGNADGQFTSPQAVAADSSGSLYIADTGNNRIQKFSSGGAFISKFAEGRLNSPQGIAVDEYGNVWVADTGNHRIVEFNAVGDFVKEYRSDEYGINPQKILVKSGKLYIADANHDKPLIWNVAGEIVTFEVSSIMSPNGDGQKDNALISYELSQPANITLSLIKENGEEVGMLRIRNNSSSNVIIQNVSRSVGQHNESWDGTIKTLNAESANVASAIPEGNYKIKITASFGDYKKIRASPILIDATPPQVSLSTQDRHISPNNDGVQDVSQLRFNIKDLSPFVETNMIVYKSGKMMDVSWKDDHFSTNSQDWYAYDWNGKINGSVIQGKYLIELRATDWAGNLGYATCEVIVDTHPPIIENTLLDNPYFSPNGDGRKDAASLSFKIMEEQSETIAVTAEVTGLNDVRIRNLMNNDSAARGDRNLIWNGLTDGGRLSSDGIYKFKISAKDEAGNTGTCDPVEVVVDTIPPEIRGLTATPNPFTPNDDGVKDTTAFTYTLSDPSYTNLKIFREDGVLFRSRGIYNITEDRFTWDGKGARGELLGGTYSYYLYAEDRAANTSTSEVKTIVVDREPSLIPYCYAEPDPFSPVNPRNNYTKVKYWVSRDNVQVQASVLGREGQIIKNLVFGETQNKGEHTARWVGDFVPGYDGPRSSRDVNRVADGAYEFKVWAYDPYNDARGENNNTVLVDNTPPYVALYPVEVDQVKRTASLRYYLPENSSVEVSAHDVSGSLIERLIPGESQEAGEYILPWDIGSRPLGRTYFTVAAEDSAKNRDEKTTEIFSINPEQELTLANLSVTPNPFTPNSDGLKDQTRIAYRLFGGVPGYRANINIFNSAGATVRRLVVNEPQNQGTYNFYWNGQADSVDPTIITYAPDGLYTYQIIAEDRLGGRVEAGGSLTLVSTKPTVNVSVSPVYISPNGDGVADTALITYSVDYPTAWIDTPAQVKLDVVSASGEAVFTRTFSQTPGTYSYTWNVRDGGDYGPRTSDVPAGTYYVFANATDALGTSALPRSALFYVDYTVPAPSNFTITPLYAKLGSRVLINLSFDEPLAENPTVRVFLPGRADGALAPLESATGNSYIYSYIVGADDPEGPTTVRVEARDLSLNPILRTQTFTIDKTNPAISNVNFSPNPAKVGDAHIDFKVNEDTSSAVVKVAQNGAGWGYATVSNLSGGNYRATHKVFSGYDGPAITTLEVADLAENLTTYQPTGLVIDTIAPTFSGISCEVNNLDFSKYAREGSEVTINFRSSEILQFNPEVLVNSGLATYFSQIGNEYSYKYTVRSDDPEGLSEISISAYDPAGNLGEKSTNTETESFRIDLTNPTVAIAAPGSSDIIASPSPFFTNADPADTSDRPNYTTLRYETSEYGFVTLKVHKVPNNLTTYTRDTFTEDNRVATLVPSQLMGGGVHNTEWRGQTTVASFDDNGDGYADPGKYAFIVEVRDRAGNVTQRKWGGTVWIQNNVLQLIQPETVGINPDPLNFSPNTTTGNSPNTTTKFWFKVLLSVTPETWAEPERIEAFAFPQTKKVGTYTVKVYDSTGSWIRTIEKDSPMYSSTDTFVIWDGKTGTGPDKLTLGDYVADGDYRLVVEVKDFAGNPAYGNLERWVKADSTLPTITDNQLGDDTWRNNGGTLYNVDLSDGGSNLQDAYYKIRRPGGSETGWYQLTGVTTGTASYISDWSIDWDNCFDGTNYISVRVKDISGNENILDNVFYVKRDTVIPGAGTTPSPSSTPTNTLRPMWSWSAVSDATSGVQGYYIQIGTSAGGSDVVPETWIGNVTSWTTNRDLWNGGNFYASIKAKDNANNIGNFGNSGYVAIDTTPPVVSSISDNGPFSPGASAGSKDTITFNYSVNETSDTTLYVDGDNKHTWSGSGVHSFEWSPGISITTGTHSYYIYAVDTAGNPTTSGTNYFTVDNSSPLISNVSVGPYIFTPDGDGFYDNTSIIYTVSEPATVAITIKDKNGNTIRTLSGGENSCVWNGGGVNGRGKYTFYINAQDTAGNPAIAQSGNVIAKGKDYVVGMKDQNYNRDYTYRSFSWDPNADRNMSTLIDANWPERTHAWHYDEMFVWTSGDFDADGKDQAVGLKDNSPDGRFRTFYWYPDTDLGMNNLNDSNWPEATHTNWVSDYKWMVGGDFNGDGIFEVAGIRSPGSSNNTYVSFVWRPQSDFNLAGIDTLSTIDHQWGRDEMKVVAGDFNGDGRDEVVGIKDHRDFRDRIFRNFIWHPDTDSSMSTLVDANWPETVHSWAWQDIMFMAAGDFDGDGKDEVAGINAAGGTFNYSVFIWHPDTDPNMNNLTDANFPSATHQWRSDEMKLVVGGDFDGLSVVGGLSVIEKPKQILVSSTKPLLLEPKDGSTITATIRPTFKWQGVPGITDYKVQLNKDFDAFASPTRILSKTVTQTESNQAIAYAIHEFDDGLAAGQWYWRVLAISGTQEAESDHWSFTIDPVLSITGITNYPNPFNPNRERTSIRYRLGRDANEVKIRIYDITGALVTELDGSTQGESVNIWSKYNDIYWDGRNGRGDMVLNGIYPFEVVARVGDRSVSGRGKIAVLK